MRLDKLIEAAREEAEECAHRGDPVVYSISTFGLVRPSLDVSIEDLILRICAEAPVGGRNVWLSTDRALSVEGFSVRRSGSQHHYDVVLGAELLVADVQRLVDLFEPTRRRNPAWKA